MFTDEKCCGLSHAVVRRITLLLFGATATFSSGWAAQDQASSEPSSIAELSNTAELPTHMPESIRSTVKQVVVIAGQAPTSQEVTGSYEKGTPGLVGGMNEGSRIGTISKEIGGVPVNIPIPVLGTLGAIFGGLSGAAKQEIQEFRDALTKELVDAESPPLRSDGLALDAFWDIRKLPSVESQLFAPTVEIPAATDAVLYISLDGLEIDVQGKEAIITASATATLHRLSDGKNVYETVIQYQDRDTLSNWTQNENELWRDYTNFARHYLGHEIAADVFGRIELKHELRPRETDTTERARKNERQFVSESQTPTLAWELTLDGGGWYGAWTDTIDEADVFYDIEIFDNRHLVYYENQVPDPSHTVAFELEACQTYKWSVRPSYHVGGDIKFGEWMKFDSEADTDADSGKGIFGRKALEAPAYIQDFAVLEIECGRR
jgi:hypothetical protein